VKFDRQIVAIAKVYKAHTIYSDDEDVKALAENAAMKVIPSWELPLPPSKTPLFPDPEPVAAPTRRIVLEKE
jgi:hypothetical protein